MSVYHDKSLFIFHTKILYVKWGNQGFKREAMDCFKSCCSFVELGSCSAVFPDMFPLHPSILHRPARLSQTESGFPSVTQQKRRERRSEVVKMELNCHSSIVRLDFFIIKYQMIKKEWDLCI